MNSIPTFTFVCERLLSALGTGILQGILLTAAVALALRWHRTANAAFRHALLMATLVVVAALPVAHALLDLRRAVSTPKAGSAPDLVTEAVSETSRLDHIGITRALPVPAPEPSVPPSRTTAAEDPLPAPELPNTWARSTPHSEINTTAQEPTEPPISVRDAATPTVPSGSAESDWSDSSAASDHLAEPKPRTVWNWRLALPAWLAAGLVALWTALAGIRLVRLALQCRALARWKRQGLPAPGRLVSVFDELRQDLSIRRPVTLRVSPTLGSPIAVGYLRPAVLIPAAANDTEASAVSEWTRILRHELAHFRRHDDWTNLAQQIAVAVFFFHPAILWLSRRITVEREIACDDHVLAARVSRREYALFLTDLARRMHGRSWSAAPAVWSNPSQLKERIHMILDTRRNASPGLARGRVGAGLAALILVAVLTLLVAPRLTVARTATNDHPLASESDLSPVSADSNSDALPAVEEVDTDVDVDTDIDADVDADVDVDLDLNLGELENLHLELAELEKAVDADSTGFVVRDDLVRSTSGNGQPKQKDSYTAPLTLTTDGGATIIVHSTGSPAPAPAPEPKPTPSSTPSPSPRAVIAIAGASSAPLPPTPAAPAALPALPTPPAPPAPPVPETATVTITAHPEVGGDLARRLDRLEKLVQKLADRETKRGGTAVALVTPKDAAPRSADGKPADVLKPRERDADFVMRREHRIALAPGQDGPNAQVHFEEMARGLQMAAKQVESAVRQAEMAAKAAEQSALARGQVESGAISRSRTEARRQVLDARRKVLDEQRRMLQKQIKDMEHQLEQLESQFDRVEVEFDRQEEYLDAAADRAAAQAEAAQARARLEKDNEHREHPRAMDPADGANAPDGKAKIKAKAKDVEPTPTAPPPPAPTPAP